MIVYKYLSQARTNVLKNHKIRFTQYGDFNDPFELNPNIDKIAEANEIKEIVKKNFVDIIEEEYEKNSTIKAFISKENFIELAQGREEEVKKLVLGLEPHAVNMLAEKLKQTANSVLGALSLSEVPNHELMWSHYADEHKGYVIGFDSTHRFFNQKKNDEDELRHLQKIEYCETPPVLNLMETKASQLFFTKSKKWEYEAEWRMILPLSDSTETIDGSPYPIHLFDFPLEAINCVILGSRISNDNRKLIESLLKDDEYSHINLCEAHLDTSTFGITIK